jgi:hypothetical protein
MCAIRVSCVKVEDIKKQKKTQTKKKKKEKSESQMQPNIITISCLAQWEGALKAVTRGVRAHVGEDPSSKPGRGGKQGPPFYCKKKKNRAWTVLRCTFEGKHPFVWFTKKKL